MTLRLPVVGSKKLSRVSRASATSITEFSLLPSSRLRSSLASSATSLMSTDSSR